MEFSQQTFDVQRPSDVPVHSLRFRVGDGPPRVTPSAEPLLMAPRASSPLNVAQLWDRILFTPYHDDVKACLRLVVPDLMDVALSTTNRKPIVWLAGTPNPVSLASMGGGATRLFQLACGLVVSGAWSF